MRTIGQPVHIEELAKVDTERAFAFAFAIDNPWDSCRAFAWTLRYAPDSAMPGITNQITRRAAMCPDDFQRAAIQAWAVSAYAERGLMREADALLISALRTARHATPCPSRSEALYLLFQAAYPMGRVRLSPMARMIRDAWQARPHWRCTRNLVHALAQLTPVDRVEVRAILESCHDASLTRKLGNQLAEGAIRPRSFFW